MARGSSVVHCLYVTARFQSYSSYPKIKIQNDWHYYVIDTADNNLLILTVLRCPNNRTLVTDTEQVSLAQLTIYHKIAPFNKSTKEDKYKIIVYNGKSCSKIHVSKENLHERTSNPSSPTAVRSRSSSLKLTRPALRKIVMLTMQVLFK